MSVDGQSHDIYDLRGRELGKFIADYTERDAILYALAVGAQAGELALVYERDLRALPTIALAMGLWAVERVHESGFYDATRALHVSQRLRVKTPLSAAGTLTMGARVSEVWDKGSAAVLEIEVDAAEFIATYGIYVPGAGGWGGDRGPAREAEEEGEPDVELQTPTSVRQAVLYRLTGDRHPVHIDPVVAAAGGFERPILHGLCTLGAVVLSLAREVGADPASLAELRAGFTAPVLPGDCLSSRAWGRGRGEFSFETRVGDRRVLAGGRVRFSQ
ncbi:MAG: MaoC/PaaZ C-terminal domain-containing protein [Actinomycetota bacterium]|nr:MaoC/PaaZ C-terminal domain-containing protein [Actinomycetota bacterium]